MAGVPNMLQRSQHCKAHRARLFSAKSFHIEFQLRRQCINPIRGRVYRSAIWLYIRSLPRFLVSHDPEKLRVVRKTTIANVQERSLYQIRRY